jgi:hypothetical protein
MDAETRVKKAGRPKGSKNKRVAGIGPPNPNRPLADYDHADPETLIARQFSIIDTAQQWLKAEMEAVARGESETVGFDVRRIHELAQALARTLESLKKSADLADEMAKRLSPQQLLEAAIKKLEAQDLATIEYAIKRLRDVRRDVAPEASDVRATDAIAELLNAV